MIGAYMEAGGNTLQRHLDSHPNLIHSPFETQLGNAYSHNALTHLYHYRYSWPTIPTDLSAREVYELLYDEEVKTYLRTPERSKFKECGMIMREDVRRNAFDLVCREVALSRVIESKYLDNWRKDYIQAYFESTFAAWENYNKSGAEDTYVGYYPLATMDTDKILTDFPTAQMIHIVRNPFSSYASTIKRPFALSLERYISGWNTIQHSALTYARKYAGRFHIIRFEDLVADKRRVMDGLMNSLGLPLSDKVYSPSWNGKDISADLRPWGAIAQSTPEANLATAHELTDEQKGKILMESHVMLGLYGYNDFLATGRVS